MPETADAVAFWSEQRTVDQYQQYWAATSQPHRHALLRALHRFPRFGSVHEIGCAVGTNLRLIREAFPWAAVSGSDVNEGAIEFARARLPFAHVYRRDALADVTAMAPRSVDVIVTCYALAYVAPTDISSVITGAINAAREGLLFVEPSGSGALFPGLPMAEWGHSYLHVLNEALTKSGRRASMYHMPLPQPVDRCNALYAVTFKERG